VGKKKRRTKGPDAAMKLPQVTPHTRCRLKLLKLERIKDYLLMEEEFIRNQERMKPQEEKIEVVTDFSTYQLVVLLSRIPEPTS
jgi:26S proteasome regulatory subunit T2